MITPYYSRDGITLYLGDCREILPQLTEKVDLVLTDPPYGINYVHGAVSQPNASRFNGIAIHGDDKPFDPAFLIETGLPLILWGGNHYASRLPDSAGWLVWDKRCQTVVNDQSDCEMAWTNKLTTARLFYHVWDGFRIGTEKGSRRVHPTQKPVALMTWCLTFFPDAHTIIDPFLGSGTTAVAAKKLGRRCIGIEINRTYLDIAIQRLSQDVMPLEVEHIEQGQSTTEQPMLSGMTSPTKGDKVTGKINS